MNSLPKITIGKKWDKGAVYCGRGSPFGNPFNLTGKTTLKGIDEEERNEVCDKYEVYFYKRVKEDIAFKDAVRSLIAKTIKEGEITLGCFCAPKRCHTETIRDYILTIVELYRNR